jgi:hypothetical protein
MKKTILISLTIIWTLCLCILVSALTDLIPNNIFKEYKYIISIGFISITGLIRIAYNKWISEKK